MSAGTVAPAAPTATAHPLSYCQESFLDQAESAVNVPAVVELPGPVDPDRVRRLLDTLTARHGALRTILTAGRGAGIPAQQRVLDRATISLTRHHHFGHLPELLPQWLLAGSERPFPLTDQLLARADLHEVGDRSVLVLWLHHTISDLGTSQVLSDEIARWWRGDELPAPVVHQADFARQERAVRPTPAQWRYWERTLAGVDGWLGQPYPDGTPHLMVRPALPVLPAEVVTALEHVARGGRTTLTAVLAAAVIAAHYRAATADRVLIGLTVSNRDQPQLRSVVGCLADQLPVVVDISGKPTFRELLGRVREALLDAYDHRVPLGRLVPLLPRRPAPVFGVNLNFLPPPAKAPKDGAPPSDLTVPYGIAKSRPDGWWLGDATLAYRPRIDNGLLAGEIEGDGFLHGDGEVRLYAERFGELLTRVAASPDLPLTSL